MVAIFETEGKKQFSGKVLFLSLRFGWTTKSSGFTQTKPSSDVTCVPALVGVRAGLCVRRPVRQRTNQLFGCTVATNGFLQGLSRPLLATVNGEVTFVLDYFSGGRSKH